MEMVLNSAPLVLTLLSFIAMLTALLVLRSLYRRNASVMKAAILSLEQSRDNSKKLDQISVQVEGSRAQQQKMFDHHRIILGSLNTQLTKIDLLLNSGTGNRKAPGRENNVGKAKSAFSAFAGKNQSYMKLDSDALPKTDGGLRLLKDVFQRREAANGPVQEDHQQYDPPRMLNTDVAPNEGEIFGDAGQTQSETEAEQDGNQGVINLDHSAGRKNLLGLFADHQASLDDMEELFKRSA
jgi:hypothetical protein